MQNTHMSKRQEIVAAMATFVVLLPVSKRRRNTKKKKKVSLGLIYIHQFKGSGSHLQSQNVRLNKNNGM